MDCGPAALKCLLEGFGVRASYGRLREACQIDLDGTSIDTLEEVANELGLEAEQVMVPADHLLLGGARTLPAVVVVELPNRLTHFVVVWRRHGGFVQVMDPATGRRWPSADRFRSQLYIHTHRVAGVDWRHWAGSDDFLTPLGVRLERLGAKTGARKELLEQAIDDPSWRSLGALDACARMTAALLASGGVKQGREATRLLSSLFERDRRRDLDAVCPEEYWSVRPAETEREEWEQDLDFRGVVLVRVRARLEERVKGQVSVSHVREVQSKEASVAALAAEAGKLSPELAAALTEPEPRPGRTLFAFLRRAGTWVPAALVGLLAVAAAGVVFEALLFRGLIDVGRDLTVSHQRLAGVGILVLFLVLSLLVELPATQGALRLGRQLETRLRMAFLRKIPRLRDRYFSSRLTSDMAERSHSVYKLRRIPELGEWLLRSVFELVLTTAGIVWLDPGSAPLALATLALVVLVPFLSLPMIQELDLRVRSHTGALSRFYLDAFLGLAPIRTHAAERPVEREHEARLLEWAESHLLRERVTLVADAILHVIGLGMVAWLIFDHLARNGLTGSVLLLVYWGLSLFGLGQLVSLMLGQQYPSYRNITLRLLEPLGARESAQPQEESEVESDGDRLVRPTGTTLTFDNVAVRAGGHTLIRDVGFEIRGGDHVAIVGPSGAGKSTLVGVLLGWNRAAVGRVRIDGRDLDERELVRLRRETAWVDPAVQLWNRSLLENVRYGLRPEANPDLAEVIDRAELLSVLELLPDGLQSRLGEAGGLVSGGEGQRVRLARAMLRERTRLAILDEPFRGLDRQQRGKLLKRARELWQDATLLVVTHDVSETRDFPRVLVLDGGRVVEDGAPEELADLPGSRYAAMLEAEEAVRRGLWSSEVWRRLRIDSGWLLEARGEGR